MEAFFQGVLWLGTFYPQPFDTSAERRFRQLRRNEKDASALQAAQEVLGVLPKFNEHQHGKYRTGIFVGSNPAPSQNGDWFIAPMIRLRDPKQIGTFSDLLSGGEQNLQDVVILSVARLKDIRHIKLRDGTILTIIDHYGEEIVGVVEEVEQEE